MKSILALAMVTLIASVAPAAEKGRRPPIKATGSIDLTDAAGDVSPIHTSDNVDYPGFDVVKVSLKSNGKQIAVVTTLKDAPGVFASDTVKLYFDTDNNPKSGAQLMFPKIGGFEYVGDLAACADYADKSSACAGGSKAKPTSHWAAVNLERYKGSGQFDKESIVDSMGFFAKKASAKTPITGNVVQGSFDYSDLHVKPGQTIRIVMEETHASDAAENGLFPDILLTLK